jgi:hypothetical protein
MQKQNSNLKKKNKQIEMQKKVKKTKTIACFGVMELPVIKCQNDFFLIKNELLIKFNVNKKQIENCSN